MDKKNLTEAEAAAEARRLEGEAAKALAERGFHPIAQTVLPLLHDVDGKWLQETSEPLFRTVVGHLEAVGEAEGVDKMIDAVMTLVSFSNEMHQHEESKKAAIVLHVGCHRVIEAHKLIDVLRGKSFEAADPAAAALSTTGAAAKDAAARAPKLGEKPPEGSMKGAALAPKRRI